ncbi:translocation/assembly module TamB [Mucilaginibacter sp. HMF5004]|uniref:translocation/assembly module TamB domain-containing protein n=1 Tax=Mucilaginibacter rivuli TaxID=2857527 RepID=UPI001C5CD9A8|nr:translocation/assembly module TamB domain-containing protein [Mucilaginibacter rivuli]MBW4888080.1 translocation/assembly module TamB [Mucilaginibacter rivuli]
MLFQYKPVQTWAAKKATSYLSTKLGTTVGIKSLYIKPFSSVVLEDLFVLDKQKDTLLNTPKLSVDLLDFSIFSSIQNRTLIFKNIQLDNGSVYIKRQKDSTSNFKFILDAFKSNDTVKTVDKPWKIDFKQFTLNNLRFRYRNYLSHEITIPDHVNFDDIDVKRFSVVLTGLDIKHHLFKADIHQLTLLEKSGFNLKNLTANAVVDTNQIELKNLTLETNRSLVKDYYKMKFKSFEDFSDYENKVYMDAHFKTSHVSSLDVAFFTINLKNIFFDLGLNGRIKGLVNNLKAKNLMVTAGQATYIKGDFNLKGLPNWDKTFLDLKFDQISSNKKDIDLLYSRFTGTPNRHVPDVVAKFGNINFSGQFTGFQNDFIAYGEFKTKLGRFNSDINLKIDKQGVPSYSGKINTHDFDLGTLTDNDLLGRTTFTGNIKGRGTELKNLANNLDAKLTYFDFKGYRYNNLTVNGTFNKKKFVGGVLVNDKNLHLDFSGDIDLSNKLPVFTFYASIKGAKLNQLKLLKDTVGVDAELTTNFTGTNISNIDGSILLKTIHLQKPGKNYFIDSVYFKASGVENSRKLILQSDLAEGSLAGNYDLGTLPDYFKSIAKKYIPSLKTSVAAIKPQNFEFNFKIRNLEPLTQFFAPELSLPDQGSFIGKFNSIDKTAVLTGSVKTIKYNNIVFHDLVIDESTSDNLLNLNVALNKVNFSDSLFVKDINISNFLKRDSLNFNIKLSDKNAVNQLDLYGLFKFNSDTTTALQLLPSDIILENKTWKLKENVQIKIAGGKTKIDGFELSNGPQKVKINGIISPDPADMLKLTFDKFNMNTLDQLSKASGIYLNGTMNGDINVASITGKIGFESDLTIDSLSFNKTLLGDVKFNTRLNSTDKVLNSKLSVFNRGLETLNASGTYDLAPTDNTLDFVVKMNQTQAIILEPFVKSLVSNLKGAISSDLKLTGTIFKPLINGTLTLQNTGLTVNYLKTPYIINDKVTIENSLIKIDNLSIKDNQGGEGIANGTVDLSKELSNPDLNVAVRATRLLALNTTYRDNRLYYGTAYGTGDFSFKGPVDDMSIDIKATTNEGTVFNIPLNTSSTASDYDFIRYVNPKDTLKNIKRHNIFKGIKLNFDLSADEKTTVKIYTDYGVLTGNGTARDLNLRISSLGDFDMYGSYLISSGKFEFTAKSVISKLFEVSQGGTISWAGDPTNATINLKATYDVRADVAVLYQAAGSSSPSKFELVQAQLGLSGPLIKPNIDFDFNFPTDPNIKDDLSTYLNDNTNRSLQAVSLIVRRQFSSTANNNLNSTVRNTAQDALTEYVFNQFNSLFAQTNIKGVDINIKSAQEASATFHFFNDRLLLSGSLFNNQGDLFGGTGTNSQTLLSSNFNNLTKDFGIQYLIRKDGRLLGTYSYRALNNTTINTLNNPLAVPTYVNGLGLIYRRDFDTFGEFFKNIFGGGRNAPAKKDSTNVNKSKPTPLANEDDD